jgi:hypothetical protein
MYKHVLVFYLERTSEHHGRMAFYIQGILPKISSCIVGGSGTRLVGGKAYHNFEKEKRRKAALYRPICHTRTFASRSPISSHRAIL